MSALAIVVSLANRDLRLDGVTVLWPGLHLAGQRFDRIVVMDGWDEPPRGDPKHYGYLPECAYLERAHGWMGDEVKAMLRPGGELVNLGR